MNDSLIDVSEVYTSYTLLSALFYVGVIALMNVVAGLLVVRQRMKHRIPLGHGDNNALMRYARLHGNLSENTAPVIGVLLGLGILDVDFWWVHAVAGSFILGRMFHAYSFTQDHLPLRPRQIGMVLTWTGLIIGALGLFWHTV